MVTQLNQEAGQEQLLSQIVQNLTRGFEDSLGDMYKPEIVKALPVEDSDF